MVPLTVLTQDGHGHPRGGSVTHLHVLLVMVISVQFGPLGAPSLGRVRGVTLRLWGGGGVTLPLLFIFHLFLLSAVVTLLLFVIVPGHLNIPFLAVRFAVSVLVLLLVFVFLLLTGGAFSLFSAPLLLPLAVSLAVLLSLFILLLVLLVPSG